MLNGSQPSIEEANIEDLIISSRDMDSNYEPSVEEIKQYGIFLGMNLEEDIEFLYIAEKGLKASIPAPWKPCQTKDGQIYYFNFETGESQWEHPCDEECRKEFRLAKAKARGTTQKQHIETDFLEAKVQEMSDIEQEFELQLQEYEKGLSLKYEHEVLELKKISIAFKKEQSNTNDAGDSVDESDEDFGVEESGLDFEQQRKEVEKQSVLLLERELSNLKQDHMLVLKAENKNLLLELAESDKSKIVIRDGKIGKNEIELSEEYNDRLYKIQIELQNKLERDFLQFKLQNAKEYSGKYSDLDLQARNLDNTEVFLQNLQKEYDSILQEEKLKLRLKTQKSLEILKKKEENHRLSVDNVEKDLKTDFHKKLKDIQEEKAEYFRQIRDYFDTRHYQLQRVYEVEKLKLENESKESLQFLKEEIKNQDKDLKIKENFVTICSKLAEEVHHVENDLIEKENMISNIVMRIKEIEISSAEYNAEVVQQQSKIGALQLPVNNKNQLLQKIGKIYTLLDVIEQKIKENEKERIFQTETLKASSKDMAKQSLNQLLRHVEGIKGSIAKKNKIRKFSPPSQEFNRNLLEETYHCANEQQMFSNKKPGNLNGILSYTENRSKSTDKRSEKCRISLNHDISLHTDLSKAFKRDIPDLSTMLQTESPADFATDNWKTEKTLGNQLFLTKPTNWPLQDYSILRHRDQNIKAGFSQKIESNLYGRLSLQNTSEVINNSGYQRDTRPPRKNHWMPSSSLKLAEKKEPSRVFHLQNKLKDDKIFKQYDNLIKKYSSR